MNADAVVASLNETVQYARGELNLKPIEVSVPVVDVRQVVRTRKVRLRWVALGLVVTVVLAVLLYQ